MRAALALCLLLVVGCTANGPAIRSSRSPSPSHSASSSPSPSLRTALTTGGVIEYALPDPPQPGESCSGCGRASVGAIAAGADGNIWFNDAGHRAVGRITTSGAVTELPLPAEVGNPYGIASGPDGKIWVTTNGGGQGRPDWILRIGPGDTITKFQAGTRAGDGFGTGPGSITAGPDGNLWFTEFWSNRIGRMTPVGVLTEFPIPTPDSAPRGIGRGPDGNVWFVESSRRHTAIAKITPAGAVTEYPMGGVPNDLYPNAIIAGPDGNLWFTQTNSAAPQGDIGRVTPNGVLTMFALPKGGRPVDLANGPDGNVWFTDVSGNAVGRMSPAGDIRQFELPRRNAQPQGIAAGSDGRMWFSEGGRIASIGVRVPEAKLSSRVLRFDRGSALETRAVDVTNTGEAGLKIDAVAFAGSDQSAFTMVRDGCTGRTVAVNASCRIELSFTPSSELSVRAARLAITDNATASPHSVSLVAQLPDCKLPLFVSTASSSTSQGEFLSLRDGTVVEDPTGGFVTEGMRSQSETRPVLYGNLPATFDTSAGRWVPAHDRSISPDGSRYAYVDHRQPPDFQLHVVDVATGRDRIVPLLAGFWAVLGFTYEGIYVRQSYEGSGPGLTLVNPDSGSVRTIFSDSAVSLVAGHVAWITTRNESDTLPQPPGMGGSSNEVQSRDLITSQRTAWIYRPGSDLGPVAAGNGSIVVSGRDRASNFLLVVSAPGQAVPITFPETGDISSFTGGLVAAANGWWLGSLDGVYLWTPRLGAVLVSEVKAALAGTCA